MKQGNLTKDLLVLVSIDKNGELKCKIIYDSIFNNEGMSLIRVDLDGMTGYINRAGKVVIPIMYEEVINYNDEAVVVRAGNKWGAYDSTGKMAVPVNYEGIDNLNVYHDNKKGITTIYVNATLKKKPVFFSVQAKSQRTVKGEYTYGKWSKPKTKAKVKSNRK